MAGMTEPSTGAGGTAVGMVKRFNQGDRVFIPAVIHAEYEGRTQPIYSVLALGDVPADRVLPASDALPAIARWIVETPDASHVLMALDAGAEAINGNLITDRALGLRSAANGPKNRDLLRSLAAAIRAGIAPRNPGEEGA